MNSANFGIRDGNFDVVVAAGPRLEMWPSPGVRAFSILCAEMGLTIGQFGGESLTVHGVVPLPATGGILLVEDIQNRIHRIRARAILRMVPEPVLPNPFPGWHTPGLIPLATAQKLAEESHVLWEPATAILGTGNRALRFGTQLLRTGVNEVFCIESFTQWKAKRFAGWEVERRQFEMMGGKIIEATPVELLSNGPLKWLFRVQDSQGIRVLEVGRVVSAGPFLSMPGVREYPPGSFLFEMDQTADTSLEMDVEGWLLEEERGRWLAAKIVKSLVNELGNKREELDRSYRKSRTRLKRFFQHREVPYTPSYQGKWMGVDETRKLQQFSGVPQKAQKMRPIASIECIEEIPCQICQDVCPTSAIQIGQIPRSQTPILNEAACTACGLCVAACPTSSIPLVKENEDRSFSQVTIPWRGAKPWKVGEFATLVNRKGENLGSARVVGILELPAEPGAPVPAGNPQLVQVESPSHLIWDARALKRSRGTALEEEAYLAAVDRSSSTVEKVEIFLNGEKRWVRDRIPISVALFEGGQTRPSDILLCKDGRCGLCQISVDGSRKPACQTRIHKGMNVRIDASLEPNAKQCSDLCPCLGVSQKDVLERLQQGKLHSPEAVLSVTHVGEGKCHGQLCMGAFRRLLHDQGLSVSEWIDWRFPWSDWVMNRNENRRL